LGDGGRLDAVLVGRRAHPRERARGGAADGVPHDVRLGHRHGRDGAGAHLADLPPPQRTPIVKGDMRELVATASRILAGTGHDDLIWGHASVRDPDGRGVWIKSAEWG